MNQAEPARGPQPASLDPPSLPSIDPMSPCAIVPWICRPEIAPRLSRDGDALCQASNGSEGCYGGWEMVYRPVTWPVQRLVFTIEAHAAGLPRTTDALVAEAFWHDCAGAQIEWDPLPVWRADVSGDRLTASLGHVLRVPEGAAELRVRCGMRWADRGSVRWQDWRLEPARPRGTARRLRLGVASARPGPWLDRATNARHYLEQCRRAGQAGVELLCLPELALTYGMPTTPQAVHAAALPIPGDWLDPFRDVARAYHMGLCFSAYERAGRQGEVVYNTAVLLGRDGALLGTYRKVHLALAEARTGVAAGHEFPTFDFHGVRIGMAICMDSTPLETARLLARQGAEVLLMPIMGDFRATSWRAGDGRFVRERWEAVQRAHALDNHLYVVAARNATEGSAITAPWGELLAYDDGSRGLIWADVVLDDVRSHPRGSTVRSVLWSMRRPDIYAGLADPLPSAPESEMERVR